MRTSPTRAPDLPVVGVRFPPWVTFATPVFDGLFRYTRLHGRWRIQTYMNTVNEMPPVKIDYEWEGDGAILFRYTQEEAAAFSERGIKIVNLSTETIGHGFPTVIPNHEQAARQAAEYLISLGLREFAYLGRKRRYSEERGTPFAAAIEAAGFPCRKIEFAIHELPYNRRWEHVQTLLTEVLRELPTPIGIFAVDDAYGAAILEACHTIGMRVPDDAAVIGLNDDSIFCNTVDPPLTTIPYPGEQIGYEAARVLDWMMKGGNPEDIAPVIRVPVGGVIERESTGVLRFQDEIVVQAIRIIRDTAPHHPLRVGELAELLPVSQSSLQKRFLKAVGMTPKAEITRTRLQFLQNLLRSTDWPITKIAETMLFETPEELSRFFRRNHHTSASEFRRGIG